MEPLAKLQADQQMRGVSLGLVGWLAQTRLQLRGHHGDRWSNEDDFNES